MAKDIKKDLAQARADAENKMRTIDFQVDTLNTRTDAGGYFTPPDGTVTLNYQRGNETFNNWSLSPSVLVHEQKHRDNYNRGLYAYALSPEQAYKVNMHDEISANMASLIYLRDEYLKNGDISVFEQDGGRFSFYTDALKRGTINPFSNKKEDFDKEMALIANGTRDMWVRDFGYSSYIEQNVGFARRYGETDGKHAAFYDQNYERAKKTAYTIGGVDFTKYMDKDVEVPEAGKRQIYSGQKLAEVLELPPYDGKMSLLQYQNLLQHAVLMKDKLVGLKSKEVLPFSGSPTAGEWNMEMSAYDYLTNKKLSDYKKDDYKTAMDSMVQNDKQLIESLVNKVAEDYAKRGEKLPEGDDKAYNDAVDKLYSGHVKLNMDDLKYEGNINLRKAFNPNDDLPLKTLPEKAAKKEQELEDMGMWGRGIKQYANFFGEDYDGRIRKDFPAAIGYPFEAISVGVGAPMAAGWKKCKEWGGAAVDTVKGWFSDDDKKEKKDNAPVRAVDKNKQPQYKEWSPEQRVSEVQKVQMLDLTADVVRKPGDKTRPDGVMARKKREGLKADMQKAAQEKAKMMQVVEGMNRINGSRNSVDTQATVNTLYDKFGDKAYDLLAKAVNEPFSFAQDIGDNSITTSRQAVAALCNTNDAQKQAVINAVLSAKSR